MEFVKVAKYPSMFDGGIISSKINNGTIKFDYGNILKHLGGLC